MATCAKDVILSSGTHRVECTLSIQARGLKAIKGVELSVTSNGDATPVNVQALRSDPEFAPPDPQPQIKSNALDPGFKAVLLERIKEPQCISWTVTVESKSVINPDSQVHRFVTVRDDDTRIEQGGSWQWKRWIKFGILAATIPLISILLLISLLLFSPQKKGVSAHDAVTT